MHTNYEKKDTGVFYPKHQCAEKQVPLFVFENFKVLTTMHQVNFFVTACYEYMYV